MGPSTLQSTQVKYKYFEIFSSIQVQVHSLFCVKDLSKVQVLSKVLKYKYKYMLGTSIMQEIASSWL